MIKSLNIQHTLVLYIKYWTKWFHIALKWLLSSLTFFPFSIFYLLFLSGGLIEWIRRIDFVVFFSIFVFVLLYSLFFKWSEISYEKYSIFHFSLPFLFIFQNRKEKSLFLYLWKQSTTLETGIGISQEFFGFAQLHWHFFFFF